MKPLFALLFAVMLVSCAAKPKQQSTTVAVAPQVPKTEEEMKQHIERLVASMKKQVDETKERLLHDTDHLAVLAASRRVMRSRNHFARDPKWHGPDAGTEQSLIAANDPKLPSVIRKLRAASLFAFDDMLRIEFGGGFHHQGFIAFAKNNTNTPSSTEGLQKVMDGLWFYEDTH